MKYLNSPIFSKIILTRKKELALVLIFSLALPFFEVSQLFIFSNLMSEMLNQPQDNTFSKFISKINFQNFGTLEILAALLAFASIFSLLVGMLSTHLRTTFIYRCKEQIQTLLFNFQMNQNWTEYSENDRAYQMQVIKEEPTRFAAGILGPVTELMSYLILAIFIISFSASQAPQLTLFSFLIFLVVFLIAYSSFAKQLNFYNRQVHLNSKDTFARLSNVLNSYEETKLYSLEKFHIKHFRDDLNGLTKAFAFQNTLAKSSRYLLEATAFVTLSLVIGLLFYLDLTSEDDFLVSLSVFGVCLLKLVPIFNSAFAAVTLYESNKSSQEYINKELDAGFSRDKKIRESREHRVKKINEFKSLEFKDICFSYGNIKVLNNVNFRMEAGKSYGIVGKSGSGKTTLVNLILGLIHPNSGKIYVNDEDASNIDSSSWQDLISLVKQNVFLFNSSILRNIIFYDRNDFFSKDIADRDYIHKSQIDLAKSILDEVDLSDYKEDKKLKGDIGDGGIKLSGGQRQRLGIARALYKNTPIMIFDEATSALDSNTERQIIKTIYNVADTKTHIMISHRIQTLERCDEIIILKNNTVYKVGKYKDLLLTDEFFRSLQGMSYGG